MDGCGRLASATWGFAEEGIESEYLPGDGQAAHTDLVVESRGSSNENGGGWWPALFGRRQAVDGADLGTGRGTWVPVDTIGTDSHDEMRVCMGASGCWTAVLA